jgi:carbonic anhydrase
MDHNRVIYEADHLHFHAPGEHKIQGNRPDLEMHIVHRLKYAPVSAYHETLAVIGVLFHIEEGIEKNPFIKELHCESFSVCLLISLI